MKIAIGVTDRTDGFARIVDVATGRVDAAVRLAGAARGVIALAAAWSPRGDALVAVACSDGAVRILDASRESFVQEVATKCKSEYF